MWTRCCPCDPTYATDTQPPAAIFGMMYRTHVIYHPAKFQRKPTPLSAPSAQRMQRAHERLGLRARPRLARRPLTLSLAHTSQDTSSIRPLTTIQISTRNTPHKSPTRRTTGLHLSARGGSNCARQRRRFAALPGLHARARTCTQHPMIKLTVHPP